MQAAPDGFLSSRQGKSLLVIFLACAFLIESFQGFTDPPGRKFGWFDFASCVVLLLGSWIAAGNTRSRLAFIFYGAVGGLTLGELFLYHVGRPYNYDPLWIQIFPFCAFVAASAFVCRGVATIRWRVDDRRAVRVKDRCQHCGYLLYGLTAKRCPECGEAFQETIPPPSPQQGTA
jgi:rRNA maturation protein Nop10